MMMNLDSTFVDNADEDIEEENCIHDSFWLGKLCILSNVLEALCVQLEERTQITSNSSISSSSISTSSGSISTRSHSISNTNTIDHDNTDVTMMIALIENLLFSTM